MLNEMRFGKLSPASIQAFRALDRPIKYNDGIEPTVLFPRREDVDRANEMKLKALNGDGWSYASTDGGAVTDPIQRAKLLANFMAPDSLELKIDAQVMLIKNLDETLVNGSMGKVIGFTTKALYHADELNSRWIPQNDKEELTGHEETDKLIMMRRKLHEKAYSNGNKPLPVVQFKIPGGHVRDHLVEHDTFKAELPNGEVQASRSQVSTYIARHGANGNSSL
jgi:ATP-dependent DNA helicase PIF1